MINQGLEAKLGFDKIRRIISDRCLTDYAADRVEKEEFTTDRSSIMTRLALTDEMRLIMMFEDSFPTTGYIDAVPFLEPLLKAGSSIDRHRHHPKDPAFLRGHQGRGLPEAEEDGRADQLVSGSTAQDRKHT